jgi:hypothetical protein
MANREQRRKMDKATSLVHKLEMTILELLGSGETEVGIHSLVNMVLNDWIVDGQITQTYLDLVEQVKQRQADEEQGIVTVNTNSLLDQNGNPLQ